MCLPRSPARLSARRILAALAVMLVATSAAAPVQADPPPWAPAHGYRAKHKHKNKHDHDVVYVAPFDIDLGRCNRELLGGVLGGAAGAAIGSTVGKGDTRTVAIVGGTIIGMIVGGSIGRAMDQVDQNCVGQALEHAADGQTILWTGSDELRYRMTPIRTYQDSTSRYCREYKTTGVIDGRLEELYGTACRLPDGSWQRAG